MRSNQTAFSRADGRPDSAQAESNPEGRRTHGIREEICSGAGRVWDRARPPRS